MSPGSALFTLYPESGVPIYRQLMDQIRRLIAAGQLQAGAELPSARDLALEHAVNPMTISKAYALLEAEGLLIRNRGKPMTPLSSDTHMFTASRIPGVSGQRANTYSRALSNPPVRSIAMV